MISKDINFPCESPSPRQESFSSSSKVRKSVKKKQAWYNSFLYPTYKTRSDDFKQTFKEIPADERLIVDYSCALQREILVQGRLYLTKNYLCFHANIFGWETSVSIKWKEVTAMTKEKTALVIPNAVVISTKNDRFFFTSFVARDKVYMMLFQLWQNALMDKPLNNNALWLLVHELYGNELGLTSDDDDYIVPSTEEERGIFRITESYAEVLYGSGSSNNGYSAMDNLEAKNGELDLSQSVNSDDVVESVENTQDNQEILSTTPNSGPNHPPCDDNDCPTDLTDNSESDCDKKVHPVLLYTNPTDETAPLLYPSPLCSIDNSPPGQSSSDEKLYPVCTSLHEGRVLMNEVIPLHVDQLFTLLFTSSKFLLDFHAIRKTADLTQTTWAHDPINGTKTRAVTLTVALNQPVGPKTAQVTESQVMLPCSKAGCLYSIDAETMNHGIPYADSFCILVHYCIHRISDSQCSFAVYAQIKYKKSVWGLVKGMIERNCWSGLEDFYSCLSKALMAEVEEHSHLTIKRKSRRRRRQQSIRSSILDDKRPLKCLLIKPRNVVIRNKKHTANVVAFIVFIVLVLLVVLNVVLYYKLWNLEEMPPQQSLLDLQILKDPPKNHEEWLKLLQKQEKLHTVEMKRWQKLLKTAIELLKQSEASLMELQRSIHPKYGKVLSVLEPNASNNNEAGRKDDEL